MCGKVSRNQTHGHRSRTLNPLHYPLLWFKLYLIQMAESDSAEVIHLRTNKYFSFELQREMKVKRQLPYCYANIQVNGVRIEMSHLWVPSLSWSLFLLIHHQFDRHFNHYIMSLWGWVHYTGLIHSLSSSVISHHCGLHHRCKWQPNSSIFIVTLK